MKNNYKCLLLSLLLSLYTIIGISQTPQLNFTLTSIESGTTKNYVARDFIILSNGFRYSAIQGQSYSFNARIDKTINITLPDGTTIYPDGSQKKPDGTIIKPDGTQLKPDGTIISPEGTIYKTDGTIINPNGTVLNISLIIPEVWFKTKSVTGDINGSYIWKDFSTNAVPLINYSSDGSSTEYTVGKGSVMNFNFNPAIDLSTGNISKEIIIKTSNLAQATIIGVWGSKKEINNTNRFIFALNGRISEGVLFSKNNIYPSIESGKTALSYGNDTLKNLIIQANSTITAKKARESSLRVASYYKSNKPVSSIWGEPKKATLSLGSSFVNTNINNTSTFSSELNNLQGFNGYTPELLVFSNVLQPVERSIFESYLAIKYGVSMDKSYLSGKGKVIWDNQQNSTYNNRITGYGRENLLGLNQNMATTSYQEAPYYSDSCDSYLANNLNNLSSRNRLLVMGSQPENTMTDGQYVLFGDDNKAIKPTNTSLSGYVTMERKWLVNATNTAKNWLELSYFDSLATGFANHKTDTYLIIDRSGTGNFTTVDYVLTNAQDVARSKIIFNNVFWYGKDVFTFGYKVSAGNSVKKLLDQALPEPINENSVLSIFYKNLTDMSTVTVQLKLKQPSLSTVLMFDLMGRLICKKELPATTEMQYLDIKLPTTGVYIIKAITVDGELTQKVISKISY